MAIRLILADDHPIIRKGVKDFLGQTEEIEVVAEAKNGLETIQLVNEFSPDVLLLDMELPDKSGVEVIQDLKAAGSPVNILGFSAYDDQELIRGFLETGAAGYLTKDESIENIIDAIRGVANGQQGWLSRRIKAIMLNVYRMGDNWHNKVSPREAQVCKLIVQGKTNKQIGYALNISEKTVEKYIYKLFQKLEVVSRVELAVMVAREKSE